MGDPGRKVVVMEAGLRARRWAVRSLPVVGFVLLALFSFGGSAHADTYNGDVEVNSAEADAFDLRDTCSSVRSNLAAWFGGPSPLRPLPISQLPTKLGGVFGAVERRAKRGCRSSRGEVGQGGEGELGGLLA